MFDTLRAPGHIISVMMLTVELKRITGTSVSLNVLSKRVSCWLVSVEIVQHHVTHVAQNTWHCEIAMQDSPARVATSARRRLPKPSPTATP